MKRLLLVAAFVSIGIAIGFGIGTFVGGNLRPAEAWRLDPTTPEFLPPDGQELDRRRWLCAAAGAVLGAAAGLIAYDAITRQTRSPSLRS